MLHTETDDSDPTFVTDLEMTDLLTALSALIILITINLQTLSRSLDQTPFSPPGRAVTVKVKGLHRL